VPSFAPTADANVLAAIKYGDAAKKDGDICIGTVSKDPFQPKCLDDGGVSMKRVLRWAPDGKSLFGFAVKQPGTFGMLRFTTKTPFSANADDWSKGKFVGDLSQSGQGIIDMSISPDGKRMAVVTNLPSASTGFQLLLTTPGDFALEKAKATGVRACKATWRPDSLEVAVVQSDNCEDGTGDIARVDVKTLKSKTLKLGGDSPAYQPVLPEAPK
jgi:hypothetical protein